MQRSRLAKRVTLLVFLLVIAAYLYGLGQFPLIGPDEPRYAQIAREMLLRNDWFTPTLGGHPWFEKPVLLYWMMMVTYKLFGISEWSARFPAALSGLVTIACIYFVSRKLDRDTAFWSVLVSATMLGMIVFSRAATFDIVLTMTVTVSLACFILSELELNVGRRYLLLIGFHICIGLSVLAKGLIGIVLPVGIAVVYHLMRNGLRAPRRLLPIVAGLPIAVLVAATWYAPMLLTHHRHFFDVFFLQHQFSRYVSNDYRHPGPIYYYLVMVVLLTLPWTLVLTHSIAKTGRLTRLRDDSAEGKVQTFALLWLIVPVVFFSFSRSKLPAYILPVVPAAALLVTQQIRRLRSDSLRSFWPLRFTGVLLIISAVAGFFYSRQFGVGFYCALAGAVVLIIAGCIVWLSRQQTVAIVAIAVCTLGVALIALRCGASIAADRESSKRLLQVAQTRGYGQTPIYGLQPDDRTPEFYAAGRVTYEPDGEPVIYIGAPLLVNETKRRGTPLLAFVPNHALWELQGAHAATTEVIADNGRYVLVAVRPR